MNKPQTFTRRPVDIQALQYTGTASNRAALEAFVGDAISFCDDGSVEIDTLEAVMIGQLHDWVIKGTKGEFYPCKPDIFDEIYAPKADTTKRSKL